jgi:hypothetical protein
VPLAQAFDLVICRATGVQSEKLKIVSRPNQSTGKVSGVPVAWKCLS